MAQVPRIVNGREMELAVPRSVLEAKVSSSDVELQFKWVDNFQAAGDPMQFLTSGDTAPNARFNYIFGNTP